MNPAHLHLIMNHIPVLGTAFGVVVLAYGAVRGRDEFMRFGLAVFVFVALVTIPVFLTGEPAEEIVEELPEVAHSLIEGHEEAGLVGLIAAEVLGALSLGALLLFRRAANLPKWFVALSLLVSVGVAGWMGWTANLGGKIRHTEVRGAGMSAPIEDESLEKDGRGRGRGGRKKDD